jgi:hypothetical protein
VSERLASGLAGAANALRRVALAACLVAAPALGQQNPSFETGVGPAPQGWTTQRFDDVAAGAEIAVDSAAAAHGSRSLRIVQHRADDFVRVGQTVRRADLERSARTGAQARRVRVTAAVRDPAGADAEAAIWLRVSGAKGVLFVDSRGDGRERPPVNDSAESGEGGLPVALAASAGGGSGRDLGWTRRAVELPLPDDADEIAFGAVLRGAGSARFDDFAVAVAPVEGAPAAPAAVRYLDAALALMERHSLNRGAVDWPALRAAALAHARGAVAPPGTYAALRFALRELGDRHSYLLAPAPAAALLAAPVSNARTGRAPLAPVAEMRFGALAYLAVPGFAGGSPGAQAAFAEDLQARIGNLDLSMACGWILDLRLNTGGNLWPMLAGLGPLLGEGDLGASLYPDGSRRGIWYRDGRAGFGDYVQLRVVAPHVLRDRAAPLAVLVGARTASSAEVLVAAFRGRPATRTFGAATRGLSAGNRTFELADGAALVLTVAATSDRAGRVDAGPIEPDVTVASATAGALPADATVAAAAAWLQTQPACR